MNNRGSILDAQKEPTTLQKGDRIAFYSDARTIALYRNHDDRGNRLYWASGEDKELISELNKFSFFQIANMIGQTHGFSIHEIRGCKCRTHCDCIITYTFE